MDKKITFITTMAGHAWGGSEELWVKLANDALKAGHLVSCSVFNWGQLPPKIEALQAAGTTVQKRSRFIYSALHKKPWGKLIERTLAARQLADHLANNDFAVVSMGGFCDLEVDAFRIPLLATKTKFSIIVHANPENYYLSANKLSEIIDVCKKAHRIYFVSDRLKEIAIRQTGYLFPNGELIVNPVNMPEVGVLPWPPAGVMQMACVGRLEASVKGHPILFQVLSEPIWQERSWHLNIYGTGPDEGYYRHLTQMFGISHRVTFHGFTNDIRNDIWANNHILLMPSYYEGMPIALIEAMLSGRTAVVTDVGGNAEILSHGETGFVSPGVNAGVFGFTLEMAWQARGNWKAIGEKAFEAAQTYFYHSNHTKDINDILNGVPTN
jgi:glycosyltransferase involved in cell wall biosynthesis